MRKVLFILVLTLLVALVSSNQVRQAQERKADNQERTEQSMRERDIELTIASVEYDDHAIDYVNKTSYKVGENVDIALIMTNKMDQRTVIGWSNPLLQNRLKLRRDGQEVAYLPEISKQLTKIEKYGPAGDSVKSIELQPNESKRIGFISLKDWYPPLEAGHYELKIKRQFYGNKIHSNTVTFEVVP
jgi:hypothetical protein